MKTKKFLLSMFSILLLATAGCSSSQNYITYDNGADITDIKAMELTEQIETPAFPSEMRAGMSVCHNIDDLRTENIVEIVRFNNGRYYSVTPVENGQYLFLLYADNDDHCVIDGYLAAGFSDKEDFKDLQAGEDRDEILSNDANAYVAGNTSYHRFSDKTVLVIEYEEETADKYIVSDFYSYNSADYKDDPYRESVIDYLLPNDLKLLL